MKPTKKMQRLLEQLAKIERMERGTLCRMSGRAHYNHQTWENKRNVVRYVPAGEAEFVQEAIQGYALFKKLSEQYADEVIKQTRRERARTFSKPQNQSTPPKKKSKEMNRPK